MSYNTTHPDYDKQNRLWKFMTDSLDGSKIKDSKLTYLPRTNGQAEIEAVIRRASRSGQECDYQQSDVEELYSAYLMRAKYPLWVKDQLRTMMGLVSNLPYDLNIPDVLKHIEDNATQEGLTLRQLFQRIVHDLLIYGRTVLAPDIDADGKIFFRHYSAQNFINWKTQNIKGRQDLNLAVFAEIKDKPLNPFVHTFTTVYRVFTLDETGCFQQVYQDGASIEDRYLGFQGKPIQYLPIVIAGSTQNSLQIDELPLRQVAECALTYYQKSADVNQALHEGCTFQKVIMGLDVDQDISYTGGGTIWVLPDKKVCDAKILEPTFQNLQVAIDEMNKQKEFASESGAKVIDLGVESGEARLARQRDQHATLRSIVLNAADAIQQALRYGFDLAMYNSDTAQHKKITFHVETEFGDSGIDVGLLNALKDAATMEKMSWDSVWSYVQDGVIPKRSYQDEQNLIESERNNAPIGGYQPNGINHGPEQAQ